MSIYGFLLIGLIIAVGVYYYMRSITAGILVALVFVSVVHLFVAHGEEHDHDRLVAKYGEDFVKEENLKR